MSEILIIDDDKGITDAISVILQSDGHVVSVAHTGEEGLNLCAIHAFDLIITDLIMPNKDGIDVILELTKAHPCGVPIIAISGDRGQFTDEFNLQSAAMIGASQTLKKPFSTAELRAAVQNTLKNYS